MGFVYRKSKRIAPGVKLNFSKSGLNSISFGSKGARLTFGSKRTTASIGLPGTGLRYQTSSSTRKAGVGKIDYAAAWGNKYVWRFIIITFGALLFIGFSFVGNSVGALYTLLTVITIYFIMSNKFMSFFKRNKEGVADPLNSKSLRIDYSRQTLKLSDSDRIFGSREFKI